MRKKAIILSALLLPFGALADCMPPANLLNIAASSNPRGDWIGWWCEGQGLPYIAVCPKSICTLVGNKRAVAAWLRSPSLDALKFGADPHTDPALRSVWGPERSLIDALKPKP